MGNRELRLLPKQAAEVRLAPAEDEKTVIRGYAAVFYTDKDPGSQYQLFPDLSERVMPTAFDRAIREAHDVCGLFNHDRNHLMGRTASGTCTIRADGKGLHYTIDPPGTQMAKDVVELIRRGDITGSSFSFTPAPGGERFVMGAGDQPDVRELTDVNVYDVGPVVEPAYGSTSTGVEGYQEGLASDPDDVLDNERLRPAVMYARGRGLTRENAVEIRCRLAGARILAGGYSREKEESETQALLIPKNNFTEKEAKSWADSHAFKSGTVTETDNYFRLEQFPEDQCQGNQRTIVLDQQAGVSAVVCMKREGKAKSLKLQRRRLELESRI
jgi:HK97 family phage prohead protease